MEPNRTITNNLNASFEGQFSHLSSDEKTPENVPGTADVCHQDAISKLASKWIKHCPELIELTLNYEDLEVRPKSIKKRINLVNSQPGLLRTLGDWIGLCTRLTFLDLSSSRLTTLPESIGQCINLRILQVMHNNLRTLPESVGKCTHLEILNVAGNNLKTLPESTGQFNNLRALSVGSNKLTKLPKSATSWIQLRELYLDENKLTSVPNSIKSLSKLELLNLQSNKLKSVPSWICNYNQLKMLDLSQNRITTLPDSFEQCSRLQVLSIRQNALTSVPSSIGKCITLQQLFLQNNVNLSELPRTYSELVRLEIIDIQGTQIPQEHVLALQNLSREIKFDREFAYLLQSWQIRGGTHFNFANVEEFDSEQKAHIMTWLGQLKKGFYFCSHKKRKDRKRTAQEQEIRVTVTKVVIRILAEALKNKEFKAICLDHIQANNESCEDRASIAINELYTTLEMLSLEEEATVEDKLRILIRGAKTCALRAEIAQALSAYQAQTEIDESDRELIRVESAYIYFMYEALLGDKLNLLTFANEKLRLGYSFFTHPLPWIDLDNLRKRINDTYLDHLIRFEIFQKMLEKDSWFSEQWETSKAFFDMEEEMLRESDITSGELEQRMKKLKNQFETKRIDLAKEWFFKHYK